LPPSRHMSPPSHNKSTILMHFAFSVCSLFFNDTATTEIYTLSLHDALPIWHLGQYSICRWDRRAGNASRSYHGRSEEHTSELQSHLNLVCRLLLEKKK